MATTVRTTRESEQRSTIRALRRFRAKAQAFFSDCMQPAVAEGSRVKMFGFPKATRVAAQSKGGSESSRAGFMPSRGPSAASLGRKIARGALTASLILAAFAATVTLQAAIHVYVLRVAG